MPIRTMDNVAPAQRLRPGGDAAEAIAELYDRYGSETYAFFRRRIGNRELAAELNQDLYLSALRALGRFRGESSHRTWLFSIAHHLLAHLRARWRTHLDEKDSLLPERIWQHVVDRSDGGPEEAVERAERALALRRCLAKLSEIHRVIVVGHYYEGATLNQLTHDLGLTNPSGSRAFLLAALRRLRRCLQRTGIAAPGEERRGGGSS